MKKDIILSGVGGQGILSIATVIGKAALDAGLSIKQAEVHGMSQRGGDVQSRRAKSLRTSLRGASPTSSFRSNRWRPCATCRGFRRRGG